MKTQIDWYLRGRADNQNRTPWKQAPTSEADWMASGGQESPELQTYWEGFFGAVSDAMGAARRSVRRAR